MKIITIVLLLIIPNVCFSHGYPTINEFQMFPETITQAVVANPAGVIVAIPFALAGGIFGGISGIFYGDVSEGATAGVMFIGLCGYMIGQQIGWPFYGVEKCIGWLCE